MTPSLELLDLHVIGHTSPTSGIGLVTSQAAASCQP